MSDFTYIPDFVITPRSKWDTLESEMESGVKQYRQKRSTKTGSWILSFIKRTLTETQAVEAFFNSKFGKATAFTWTCPLDNTEYTVRFTSDDFSYEANDFNNNDFEVGFEEDIS